jgi:CRP-like cAMP-binding protein
MTSDVLHASILHNVAKHIHLNDQEKDYFTTLLQYKAVPKRTLILKEGELCEAIHYIHKGAFRAFFRDAEGHESDVMFGIDDWWITDLLSFVTREPAMLHIEAMEEGELFALKRESLDQLFETVPKFERFFRIIFQNSYIREQLRTVQNLSMNAAQRYEYFTKKYPLQVQRIPQKYIASYLGMTPEFLSVIRKKKSS